MTNQKMERKLQARHITMIAIGGCIGTGLFMASGAVVSKAGSYGAVFTYGLIGVVIYFLMASRGEHFILFLVHLVRMQQDLLIQD